MKTTTDRNVVVFTFRSHSKTLTGESIKLYENSFTYNNLSIIVSLLNLFIAVFVSGNNRKGCSGFISISNYHLKITKRINPSNEYYIPLAVGLW